MSQAEELLTTLSETVPEHIHVMTDADKYFIIDPISRTIANPIGRPLVLMQRDHNSTVYTFQLPRYVDGHDMVLCNRVKCHFNNIEVNSDAEIAIEHPDLVELTDLRVNPDDTSTVICSWAITRQATFYPGTLGFFIQYLCVDAEGNETYEWHTDTFSDVIVNKTRHNDEAPIIEYTAIFEQWRERIFGAGNSVKNELIALTEQKISAIDAVGYAQAEAVANEGLRVLNTIPEDYSAMSTQVNLNKRFSAPVIVQESEGERIVVEDSAKMPILGLQMFGKSEQQTTNGYQLCDMSRFPDFTAGGTTSTANGNGTITVTGGGVTVVNNDDGSLTISGSGEITSLFSARFDLTHEETLKLLKAGDLHCNYGAMTLPPLYIQLNNGSGTLASMNNKYSNKASMAITQEMLDDEESFLRFSFYQVAGDVISSGTIKPMLYQDGDGTWEPFSGGKPSPSPEYPQEIVNVENPTVSIYGKNLVHPVAKARTVNGYLITPNADGTTTISGSAISESDTVLDLAIVGETNDVYHYTNLKGGVQYTITCWKDGKLFETPGVKQTLKDGRVLWGWTPIEQQDRTINKLYRQLTPTIGDTSVCGTYAIQIEIGEKSTEYEPYVDVQELNSLAELPGIPVSSGGNHTDENGQQYIANYRDWERGVDVKHVVETVLNGTEPYEDFITEYATITLALDHKNLSKIYCTHSIQGRGIDWANTSRIKFDTSYFGVNTIDEFKIFVANEYNNGHPIKLIYCINRPIETPIPEVELQAYREIHTNYPNTTILNDSGTYMKVSYGTDTKTYIDNKIKELIANS